MSWALVARRLSVALTLTLAFLPAAAAGREAVPAAADIWRKIFARPAAKEPSGPADAKPIARVSLGARLFSDNRLSGDGKRSCTTCHRPDRGFSDGRVRGLGRDGAPLSRNTPTLWNLRWARRFNWDGRAVSLADQAVGPITHSNEMAGDFETIAKRLRGDPAIALQFAGAFPGEPIGRGVILQALEGYVGSLVSAETRFDRWLAGDRGAITMQEFAGFRLFTGKAGCIACHGGWRFTDDRFHDVGLPSADKGRGALTPRQRQRSAHPDLPPVVLGQTAFKTPTLRELSSTAPYMHDGSLPDLAAVVRHYDTGVVERSSLAPALKRRVRLSRRERDQLVAFLATLSSE